MGKFKLTDNLNAAQEDAVDLATIVANLLNRYLKYKGPIPLRVTAPSTFGGTYVARVAPCDNILYTFRELCERLELNRSQYTEWRPHVSAPKSSLLRASGSFMYITKAELR
jgi:hypothetical protein